MTKVLYMIRPRGDIWNLDHVYNGYPKLFSLEVHHGGVFTDKPGRRYINGRIDYVDCIDIDEFSVHEMDSIMVDLGYRKNSIMYYNFLTPESDLDVGLKALGNDLDVRKLSEHVFLHNLILVYIEHGTTRLDTYFEEGIGSTPLKSNVVLEEIDDDTPLKDKTPFTNLLLGWTGEVNASVQDKGKGVVHEVSEREESEREDSEREHSDREDSEREHGDREDSEREDSDYIVDEVNEVEEVHVDMTHFNLNVDVDVEFMGCQNEATQEESQFANVEVDIIDNDDFDSGSDCENLRDRLLHKLEKKRKARDGAIYNTSFYVGKPFGSKLEVKELVKLHSIETRRQLKILKNDKERIRVVCEGRLPVFTDGLSKDDGPGKDNGPSVRDGPVIDGPVNTNTGPNTKGKTGVDKETKGKETEESCSALIKNKGGRGVKTDPDLYPCPWILLVSKVKGCETWLVKTYKPIHKCLQSRTIKACTSNFLAKTIVEQVEGNPEIPARALQDELQRKFEVGISKMKAFRAKRKAIGQLKGDYTTQYNMLRDYIQELKKQNPDTTVKLDVQPPFHEDDTTRVFKRIYVCLGALKRGFKSIGRKLLGVDGAFMAGPFPGQVLTAVGLDPNNGIYPVAYAIVEAETKDAWIWFLDSLSDDLDLNRNSNFTFVSDRQKGILPAVAELFPCAEHRFCVRHIHDNMKKEGWRGTAYKDHLWNCATKTTVQHFQRSMEEFKRFNVDAYTWLSKIPPQHWSRAHFSGLAKSDVLLNNMCEVLNKQLKMGRDKPIIHCLEYIREYLMIRIVNVLKVIKKCDGPLTPTGTRLLELVKQDATKYKAVFNGGSMFQVTGPWGDQCVVDVKKRVCTCRKWEVTGIPCKHAVACNWNMAINNEPVGLIETWVDPIYRLDSWKLMYKFMINPLTGATFWEKSPIPTTITPPKYHTPVGRPKKKRRKSAEEVESMVDDGRLSRKHTTVTCSKCGNTGHNKKTCKGQQDQVPATQPQTSQHVSGSQPTASSSKSTSD